MASDAVGLERISKVVGYKITKGDFSEVSPNLPQRIAILAEANHANQGSLDTDPWEATSAQAAGVRYGYGSPIYNIMRILRPVSGTGIGGIPVIVYPQAAAGGATAKVYEVTPTGVATGNGTHTVIVAGRRGVDGASYSINVNTGDTADIISGKIADAINNVLGSPVSASDIGYSVELTSKWRGLTADAITLSVDTNGDDLGISYVVNSTQSGSGTPSIQTALESFGNEWNTIVVNSYGTHNDTMDTLETFNGIPDPANPTGRYSGIIMKPFIALTGSIAEDPSSITSARRDDVTIAICPAPLSAGQPMEAAANMCVLFGRQAQDTPELDVSGRSYPDMPTPSDIGAMNDYEERDRIVKLGCSTVQLIGGKYQVMDFVTTYRPEGEIVPQFRFCRNLVIDFNIRYGYFLLEQKYVVDHVIASDNDVVSASKVVKPKQWKSVVRDYSVGLGQRGLIADVPFMQNSIIVNLSTANPDRLETFFRAKRSGYGRISSTTAEMGFNFGTLN
jgi:phage tail sheath gpL-like